MTALDIQIIPALSDNYVYLVRDPESGACAAVDPAAAAPVLEAVSRLGWKLGLILCTHHHADHIGGVVEIKKATGCTVVGAAADAPRIPGIDVKVKEGDAVALGAHAGRVIETPGHTSGHIAYWFEGARALFCGDTLFSLGCGRLFEGTPAQMWKSLLKLRSLPDDAQVYCGHEYTSDNVAFALSLDPDNPAISRRADEALALGEAGRPTLPARLGDEKATNPFLRADHDPIKEAVGLAGQDAVEVFAEIRRRKDEF
ncbi:MAG: hydroxyacylglutathione hydrolase [Rhodospirillales bacterium]|jgi:hydroxyacylglutathione hydrolase|nr:hydroxyacylglutathione hydrolase [Rhodospirillales bacterium]